MTNISDNTPIKLNRLKGLMREYDITQTDMALYLGRSVSGLCKILNGEVEITYPTMKKVVTFLNIKRKMLGGENTKEHTLNDVFC